MSGAACLCRRCLRFVLPGELVCSPGPCSVTPPFPVPTSDALPATVRSLSSVALVGAMFDAVQHVRGPGVLSDGLRDAVMMAFGCDAGDGSPTLRVLFSALDTFYLPQLRSALIPPGSAECTDPEIMLRVQESRIMMAQCESWLRELCRLLQCGPTAHDPHVSLGDLAAVAPSVGGAVGGPGSPGRAGSAIPGGVSAVSVLAPGTAHAAPTNWHFTQSQLRQHVLEPMERLLQGVDVDASVLLAVGNVDISAVLGSSLRPLLRGFKDSPHLVDLSSAEVRVLGAGQSAGSDEAATGRWRSASDTLQVFLTVASPCSSGFLIGGFGTSVGSKSGCVLMCSAGLLQVGGSLVAVWTEAGPGAFGVVTGCAWLVDRRQNASMSFGAVVCCFPTADERQESSRPGPDSYYLVCALCCTMHRVGKRFTCDWETGLVRRWQQSHTACSSTNQNPEAMPGVSSRHFCRLTGTAVGLACYLSTLNSQPEQSDTPNPQPSTLNPQPSTLNPQPSTNQPSTTEPSTLNPQPLTINPEPSTPNPQHPTLNRQPSTLNLEPSTLNPQP
jgi:hypothetical protein